MLRKWEVPNRGLSVHMINALPLIDEAFMEVVGEEAVCTSTYTDPHKLNSRHYYLVYGACDFRLKFYDMPTRDDIRLKVKEKLRDKFGKRQYDVVFSKNDTVLHVEYDPKDIK